MKKRTAGEIVDVLERDTHQFVGRYFESQGTGLVLVHGGVFKNAVPVGDPGAKNAQADDAVVIEMVRFPTHWHDGEGVIVEVLGPRGDPAVDTLAIIREFNLPGLRFRKMCSKTPASRRKLLRRRLTRPTWPSGRTLTDLPIITIDPATARDFDDAISLEKDRKRPLAVGRAHRRRFAFLCNPAPHSTAKRKTGRRASICQNRVIPMLPEIISNNLASFAASPRPVHQNRLH